MSNLTFPFYNANIIIGEYHAVLLIIPCRVAASDRSPGAVGVPPDNNEILSYYSDQSLVRRNLPWWYDCLHLPHQFLHLGQVVPGVLQSELCEDHGGP